MLIRNIRSIAGNVTKFRNYVHDANLGSEICNVQATHAQINLGMLVLLADSGQFMIKFVVSR